MERTTPGLIVFVLAALVVVSGVLTRPYASMLMGNFWHVAKGDRTIAEAIAKVEEGASVGFRWRNALMDLHSILLRTTGTRIVEKADATVVLADNGHLCEPLPEIPRDVLEDAIRNIAALQELAADSGAPFLFVLVPDKSVHMSLPAFADTHAAENHARFAQALKENSIDHLDLDEAMRLDGLAPEEVYFVTDHHWKPECGLWATGKICEELGKRGRFEFDAGKCRLGNYGVKNFKNWFLGSFGKKAGRFFSPLGVDDILLITPRFETELVEEQPAKNEVKRGTFSETVLELSSIENRDLHGLNPYAAYSGGDFRLQKITNKRAGNGKKLLLVRDSFACVVLPFLCLHFGETWAVDIRDGDSYVGKKESIPRLIRDFNPDWIVVLYGCRKADMAGRYDFFPTEKLAIE